MSCGSDIFLDRVTRKAAAGRTESLVQSAALEDEEPTHEKSKYYMFGHHKHIPQLTTHKAL